MITVYAVMRGDSYEGSTLISLHATRDLALAAAEKQPTCFAGGWVKTDLDYWENGCDYLSIEELEVEEAATPTTEEYSFDI